MDFFITIILSLVFGFFSVFPFYLITEAIANNPNKQKAESEKLKKLAIERGHVVTASLIKIQPFSVMPAGRANQTEDICIYEYYYKGKRYIYRYRSDYPESPLTLYFVSNPRKAAVSGAIKDSKVSWPILFGIITLIWFFIFYNSRM